MSTLDLSEEFPEDLVLARILTDIEKDYPVPIDQDTMYRSIAVRWPNARLGGLPLDNPQGYAGHVQVFRDMSWKPVPPLPKNIKASLNERASQDMKRKFVATARARGLTDDTVEFY